NQSLLDPNQHLNIVDDFGGIEIKSIQSELKSYYDKYKALRREYLEFNLDEEALKRETELLKFELKEIEEAALTDGEDEALETEYKKLTNSEKINSDLHKAYISLDDESSGVLVKIADALRNLNEAVLYEPELNTYKSTLLDLDSLAKDISRDLSHYIDNNTFDSVRYKEIQERLNQINHLKSKYGNTISGISDYAKNLTEKLEKYDNYESLKSEKEMEMKNCAVKLNRLANDLSATRKKVASILEPLIVKNLIDLNFLNVDFKIHFDKNTKIAANGYDKAEFMLSTNPGEPLSPMVKTASGGELSRIMLAIKSSIAENDDIATMIFDEIDTGISGKTAGKVAEKLNLLSKNHQIICITHLPQIAAMADSHYSIKKEVTDGATISGVVKLSENERIEELANILGGVEVSSAARVNAKELIDNANKYKLTI
ncbi:MAG: DNA repair protein RecN, partial [Lachnospiraceae bacterium]|nr:DNA repair protein RecN [Lachnospiraceae bacterium]